MFATQATALIVLAIFTLALTFLFIAGFKLTKEIDTVLFKYILKVMAAIGVIGIVLSLFAIIFTPAGQAINVANAFKALIGS